MMPPTLISQMSDTECFDEASDFFADFELRVSRDKIQTATYNLMWRGTYKNEQYAEMWQQCPNVKITDLSTMLRQAVASSRHIAGCKDDHSCPYHTV